MTRERFLVETGCRRFVAQVYVVYFKTNKRFLHEYAHLPNYVRDVYQTPGMHPPSRFCGHASGSDPKNPDPKTTDSNDPAAGMAASVDMQHIKNHYFSSHPLLNPYAIVPVGGEPWWEGQHDRHRMTKV
jgi:putative glutathione S-transferase